MISSNRLVRFENDVGVDQQICRGWKSIPCDRLQIERRFQAMLGKQGSQVDRAGADHIRARRTETFCTSSDLKEHNHSSQFFKLLDKHPPLWRERKTRLNELAGVNLNW